MLNKKDYISLDASWNKHAYYYLCTDTPLEDGYYRGQLTHYCPYFPGQENLQSDQQRYMATLQGVFYLPKANTLNVGAEYRYDYLKAPMRVNEGTANDWTAALYAQDEWNITPKFKFTYGLRVDGFLFNNNDVMTNKALLDKDYFDENGNAVMENGSVKAVLGKLSWNVIVLKK